MPSFDPDSFRQFLGQPTHVTHHAWGSEKRYVVSTGSLAKNRELLRDTLYCHHSSFDLTKELVDLGYPCTANALRQRSSGNPADAETTQMAHLGEVLGAEYVQAFLGYTARFFPKRFNPNPEQSMKGPDIIGLRDDPHSPHLLIGEAKTYQYFDGRAIAEAYDYLIRVHHMKTDCLLHPLREMARAEEDRAWSDIIARHLAFQVPRQYLILSITESSPKQPFGCLDQPSDGSLPGLMAVHVQIADLKQHLRVLFQP